MRRVLVLVMLSEAIAAAEPPLPIDVVSKGKPGDWAIYETEQDVGNGKFSDRIVATIVTAPSGNKVVWFRGPKDAERYFYVYLPDAGKGPDPRMLEKSDARDMKSTPAKCKLATEIACTKVTFLHQGAQATTLMMSAQVRATGVIDVDTRSGSYFIKMHLVGYGNGAKAEWGVGPTKAKLDEPNYKLGQQPMPNGGSGPNGGWGGGGGSTNKTPSPPSVSIGQPNVQGDLDKAIVRRYVKRNIQKIQYCYEKELVAKPNLKGTLQTEFTIGGDGKVKSSTARGVDPNVATCVAGVIKTIEFPTPKDGKDTPVFYPFTFRPNGDL